MSLRENRDLSRWPPKVQAALNYLEDEYFINQDETYFSDPVVVNDQKRYRDEYDAHLAGWKSAIELALAKAKEKAFTPYDDYCEHPKSNGSAIRCVAIADLEQIIKDLTCE